MTAGRKPIEFVPQDKPVIDAGAVNGELLSATQLGQLQQSVNLDQMRLSEWIGMRKGLEIVQKLVTVTDFKMLSEIKESKLYKGLQVFGREGKPVTVTTWEQFCETQGLSREHVDEGIRNLAAFGEAFLETSSRMGVGFRDLRKLRQLPSDSQEMIINGEAVQTSDRATLLDLIEEQTIKHQQEKEAINKKLVDTEASLVAARRVVGEKETTITGLQEKLALDSGKKKPTPEFMADGAMRDVDNEALSIANRIAASLRSYLVALADPALDLGDLLRQQAIRAAVGRILAATHQLAQDFDVPVSGPSAAHENGELDEVWSATLTGYESGDDHVSGS